ncbi:hypothetical protein [Brunnivagina elsteri]|uniref:hypothetical protein n=1 Tax=Brunnivagina elsteri TaxID=1247191 RepID=UPI0011787976|nr:hypothetical protein [Calothrix elsteri]
MHDCIKLRLSRFGLVGYAFGFCRIAICMIALSSAYRVWILGKCDMPPALSSAYRGLGFWGSAIACWLIDLSQFL